MSYLMIFRLKYYELEKVSAVAVATIIGLYFDGLRTQTKHQSIIIKSGLLSQLDSFPRALSLPQPQ